MRPPSCNIKKNADKSNMPSRLQIKGHDSETVRLAFSVGVRPFPTKKHIEIPDV